MMIHDITQKAGHYPSRKRRGRGNATGVGGTSGRGHKGAKSRSGWAAKPAREGGQLPFFRRIPKRGFSNVAFAVVYQIVNVADLEQAFKNGDEVNAKALAKAGVIRDASAPVKVLGQGEITRQLRVSATKFSASAAKKIEAAGGSTSIVEGPKKWVRPTTKKAAGGAGKAGQAPAPVDR